MVLSIFSRVWLSIVVFQCFVANRLVVLLPLNNVLFLLIYLFLLGFSGLLLFCLNYFGLWFVCRCAVVLLI